MPISGLAEKYIGSCEQPREFQRMLNAYGATDIPVKIYSKSGKLLLVNDASMQLHKFNDETIGQILDEYNILDDKLFKSMDVAMSIKNVFLGHYSTIPSISYPANAIKQSLDIPYKQEKIVSIQAIFFNCYVVV